ncbi:MAG: MFS transporter, partial [Eubacterium sp.]
YLTAFNLTNMEFGNLGSVYGLVSLFCYLLGGFFADRYSIKALMTVSFSVCAAMTFWEAMFPSYVSLIIIHIVFAIFNAATMWPAYIKFLRSLGSEQEQGKLFGTSEALRGVISGVVGFIFLSFMSLFASEIAGIQMVLISSGVLYVLFAVLSLIFLPKNELNTADTPTKTTTDTGNHHSTLDNLKTVLKLPGTWILSIFMFSCYCVLMAGINYLGTYTTQILGISPEVSSGLAIFRNYIIVVVAGILGGILADKMKSRLIFIVYLMIGIILCSGIIPFISQMTTLSIVIAMVLSLFYYCVKSVYFSVMGEGGIPMELTGIASGFISFIAFMPDAFLTTLMGSWIDQDPTRGFNMIFIWMIAWSIIAIIFAMIIYNRKTHFSSSQ